MNFGLGHMNRCRLCAPLAPIKVKIITDNTLKTIVFGNTEMIDSLNAV